MKDIFDYFSYNTIPYKEIESMSEKKEIEETAEKLIELGISDELMSIDFGNFDIGGYSNPITYSFSENIPKDLAHKIGEAHRYRK